MKFDKKYFTLIKHLIKEGISLDSVDGIEIKSVPFYSFNLDLSDEFPISKFSNISFEEEIIIMLWNFQMMSNDVRELQERGIHKLDEFMIDSDGIYRRCRNNKSIDSELCYGEDFSYTIGTSLGYIIDYYNLSRIMEDKIKNRNVRSYDSIDFHQNEFANTSTYNFGICSCSWYISSNKLNFNIALRNVNLLTDLPNLVVQYSTLLMMMATVSKLEIGKINFSIENVYVELNELEKLNKQLDRWNTYQKMTRLSREELTELNIDTLGNMSDRLQIIDMILNPSIPEIWLNPNVNSFFEFDNSIKLRDIKIKGYRPFVNFK